MLNGQTISNADYPELFVKWGVTADSLNLPDFSTADGCTVRHVKEGSGRNLGNYEKDSLKAHVHDASYGGHTIPNHAHGLSQMGGNIFNILSRYNNLSANGSLVKTSSSQQNMSPSWDGQEFWYCNISIYSNKTTDGWAGTTGGWNGNTASTGDTETRMKNLTVQMYIKAKVLI